MTFSRRAVLVLGIGAAVLSTAALAATKANFTPAAFEAANKAGQPILVEVTAPWCPTCKAQAPILGELSGQSRFKELRTFTVDFDSQKDVLKTFNVQMQSTLIVFKGGKEVGRSTGETRKDQIVALLKQAL